MRKYILMMIAWLMMFSLVNENVMAQSEIAYDITQAQIKADVTAEGMMNFTDVYTYKVDQMNGVYFDIDFEGAKLVEYQMGIKNPETGKVEYFKESASHLPKTYVATIEDNLLRLKVFYPASEETVDFVFEYTLDGLVTNYLDTAEINRKFIGTNINESLDVTADIILPGAVGTKEDLRAWLYGDPQGNIQLNRQERSSSIHIEVPNNSANQFVEINALFPTSLTPNNRRTIDKKAKEDIISRSDQQVQEDARSHQLQKAVDWGKILLGLLIGPLLTLWALYYYFREKNRLNPNPKHVPKHVYELPEDIPPAIMTAAYLDRDVTADDFSATILDLARRKYIELIEIPSERRSGLFNRGNNRTIMIRKLSNNVSANELNQHEVYVMHYLFDDDQTEVNLSHIEKLVQQQGAYAKQQNRLWSRFKNYAMVKGQQHVSESNAVRMKCRQSVVLSTIMAFILVPLIFMLFIPYSIIKPYMAFIGIVIAMNMLLNIILMLLLKFKPIYSEHEDLMRKSWKGFARMLDDIGQMDMREIASLPLWDKYLAYAVSLGVADKVIEAMNKVYGLQEMEANLSLPRGFYSHPYLINSTLRGSLQSSITSAQPTVTQTMGQYRGDNFGGFGGGASGGSSSGSGGRGGTGGF